MHADGPLDAGAPTTTPTPRRAEEDVFLAWAVLLLALHVAWMLAGPYGAAAGAVAQISVSVAFAARSGGGARTLGVTADRPLRALLALAATVLVVLPAFAIGYRAASGLPLLGPLDMAGFAGDLARTLVLAALPEEMFFRGYVQPALAARLGGPADGPVGVRALWTRPVALSIAGSALLFAVTHAVLEPRWLSVGALARLLTFFPGLVFGALRVVTGSIWAPALFHALCNAWLFALQRSG